MSTPVSWPPIGGTPYSIPATGELNWQALSNFLIALGNKAQSIDNTKLAIRTATTSPVTVATASDTVVVCALTVPGSVTVNLPAGITGQTYVVVDGTGDASVNNITIDPNGAELINGSSTYVINKDRAGVLFAFNGVSWTILAEYTNIAAGTIPRSSIAPGSPNQVVINDGSGNLSSEAALAKVRGGTGADNSAVTFPTTGTIPTNTSASTFTNKVIDGDDNTVQDLGISSLKTVIGNATKFLSFDGAGAPVATKAVPTGDVLGTSDAQVVTSKDIDGGTASNTDRITVPSGATAALNALNRKAGTIVYDTTLNQFKGDNGSSLVLFSNSTTATPTALGVVTDYAPVVQSSPTVITNAGYTILTTDGFDTVAVSTGGSNRTITLPASASNIGRKIFFKKTDSGAGNVIVTAAGADLIDGAATQTLFFQYESMILICVASGVWVVEDYLINGNWVSYTPIIQNGGTTSTNASRWQRLTRTTMALESYQVWTGAGSAATMTWSLPSGYTQAAGLGPFGRTAVESGMFTWYNGTAFFIGWVIKFSSTTFCAIPTGASQEFQGTALTNGRETFLSMTTQPLQWA